MSEYCHTRVKKRLGHVGIFGIEQSLSTPEYSRYQIHATGVVDLRQEKSVAKSKRISLTQALNVGIIEGYRISHMLSYNENDRNDAGYPGGDFGQGGKGNISISCGKLQTKLLTLLPKYPTLPSYEYHDPTFFHS